MPSNIVTSKQIDSWILCSVVFVHTYLCFPLMGPLKSGSYFSGSPVNDKQPSFTFLQFTLNKAYHNLS